MEKLWRYFATTAAAAVADIGSHFLRRPNDTANANANDVIGRLSGWISSFVFNMSIRRVCTALVTVLVWLVSVSVSVSAVYFLFATPATAPTAQQPRKYIRNGRGEF